MIKTTVETITPTVAQSYLKKNKNNRRLKQAHVDVLARSMIQNDWKINGESIKFDSRGNLLDGQHRLIACIQSKTSFKTMVVKNLPATTFDTIDTGQNRQAPDILSINGEKNVSLLAGVLKWIYRYENKSMRNVQKITNKEVERVLKAHPDIREFVNYVASHRVRWCGGTVLAFSYYMASQKHPVKAKEFFESLIHGTNLQSDSIILTLRNKFIDISANKMIRFDSTDRIELIAICWNLWLKGRTLKQFKLSKLISTKSEDFTTFNK